jgi:uncharacterized protein (DUF1499 family)
MLKFPGKRPTNLGIRDGKLAPCPSSPNCVSSQASDDKHSIAPLGIVGDPSLAIQRLKKVVESMPRTQVVEAKPEYLRVEFASQLLGFVDDVEFYCDGKVIHVRSASRLGYSDLGVNRKRVEEIRRAFAST